MYSTSVRPNPDKEILGEKHPKYLLGWDIGSGRRGPSPISLI